MLPTNADGSKVFVRTKPETKLRLHGSNREYQMYTLRACVVSILHISAPIAYRGELGVSIS